MRGHSVADARFIILSITPRALNFTEGGLGRREAGPGASAEQRFSAPGGQ
jgi:hypothetical protein